MLRQRAPRPGELTPAWRVLMALTWLAVGLAMGAVWSTSDQLGLATWWLGPRGEPNPQYIQVAVFLPALAMVLISVNRVRYASWFGVAAAAVMIAIGVADLSHVAALGMIEIAIGVAAGLVSLASLTGMYRRQPTP